ncbi:MAG: hypothetical protein HY658_02680 [Actinobacteria bacterium]|nr:hypothetical protein [Actinomycetota bacterium]
MRTNRPRRLRTALIEATAALALLSLGSTVAGAESRTGVAKWWQYDKSVWSHGYRAHPDLVREDTQWEKDNPEAKRAEENAWEDELTDLHLAKHFHRAISWHKGYAVWYGHQAGSIGACGVPLTGLYAAHRTLPCGSLVSVRANGRYVLVTIKDRGPYGSSSRILDLSPAAFQVLAPLSQGVVWINAVRIQP